MHKALLYTVLKGRGEIVSNSNIVSGPVAEDGATTPLYGVATYPQAFYDAGLNKTFVAWESWSDGGRAQKVTAFDHATSYYSVIEGMGQSPLANNDHGVAAICLDHENHLHAFYGSHASSGGMRHSSTRWAWDGSSDGGSKWGIRTNVGAASGLYTYPKPFMVGSTMHLVMRDTIDASTTMPLVRFATTALTGGVPTWGAEATLIDFGADSRVYAGNGVLVGTDWHVCVTKGDFLDTTRVNVYYFVLDTTTGNLENHNGSTTVAPGSQPVSLATANSDFRLFAHSGGNDGIIPALAFDTNGDPFVAFADGTGTAYGIKVIKRTGGVWGSPEAIATTDFRHNLVALGQLPGGEMEIFYTQDPASAWARGGDMTRKVRSAGGAWGSPETVLAATDFALNVPSIVQDGQGIARVIFTEQKQVFTDPAVGELKVYLWGNQGLVGYQQAPSTITSAADGVELREGGDAELREDGFDELREIAA